MRQAERVLRLGHDPAARPAAVGLGLGQAHKGGPLGHLGPGEDALGKGDVQRRARGWVDPAGRVPPVGALGEVRPILCRPELRRVVRLQNCEG